MGSRRRFLWLERLRYHIPALYETFIDRVMKLQVMAGTINGCIDLRLSHS